MKKRIAVSLALLTAISLNAAAGVATINMEEVIMAHPKTEVNKQKLLKVQADYEDRRTAMRDKISPLIEEYKILAEESQSEALSDKARRSKIAEARTLEQKIRKEEEAMRKAVLDLQVKLQEQELELFREVTDDVSKAVNALAEDKGIDIVLDKSAYRSSAPIPLVIYSKDDLDITDAVIELTGGTRVEKSETTNTGSADPE